MTADEIGTARTEIVHHIRGLAPAGPDQLQIIVHLMAVLASRQDDPVAAIDSLAVFAKEHLSTLGEQVRTQ